MENEYWCLYHSLTGHTGLSKANVSPADEADKAGDQRLLTQGTASVIKSQGKLARNAVTKIGSNLHTAFSKS